MGENRRGIALILFIKLATGNKIYTESNYREKVI